MAAGLHQEGLSELGVMAIGYSNRPQLAQNQYRINAEINVYQSSDELTQEYQMLQKAKSKDALLLKQNNVRQRYMQMAGAQQVLQGGRQDRT